ncbi:methyltransferase [Asticcacaulis sp. BYS171W]|uniref:Methyltransferase n=1 Tax=Asticcacaulis aquaticus TaxID=2984212 RepID=A0ABT5HYU0_9CAUL|nr:methyltransferase [Asticcacaulis aquaticus]MDC7685228.1 methyltransferase [Asticcacaulis aquaticus]
MRLAVPTIAAFLAVTVPAMAHEGHDHHAVATDVALKAAVDGAWRTAENKDRDQFRHPVESLNFWGLKPGAQIVEYYPGAKGWWTEILAPYAYKTKGTYTAVLGKVDDPAFWAEVADKSIYGEVKATTLADLPAGQADLVLIARAFHNWARQDGATERHLDAAFKALKSGGVLAVEQHRAPEGSDPKAGTGYVPESYVIEAAKKAGFVFVAKSDINANAKDTRDHPFGVWTLKPIRRSEQAGRTLTVEERAKYDAIGESDRMTLTFRKP